MIPYLNESSLVFYRMEQPEGISKAEWNIGFINFEFLMPKKSPIRIRNNIPFHWKVRILKERIRVEEMKSVVLIEGC